MPDECGRETPAAAQAYMVRPEQSNAFGPAAPQAYGLPSTDLAAETAIAPRPLLTGALTAGAVCTGVVRGSSRLLRWTSACICVLRKVCRSAADSRSNIALLWAARLDRSVRLAARSRVSLAAAACAALASAAALTAVALALLASVSTAERRLETTSMRLAWAAKSPGESLYSIAPKVPNGSERVSDATNCLIRLR